MIVVLRVMSGMDLSHNYLGLVGLESIRFESGRFGSWYEAGVKPLYMVWLQVGCL
jgi:hypothetical protein